MSVYKNSTTLSSHRASSVLQRLSRGLGQFECLNNKAGNFINSCVCHFLALTSVALVLLLSAGTVFHYSD